MAEICDQALMRSQNHRRRYTGATPAEMEKTMRIICFKLALFAAIITAKTLNKAIVPKETNE